MRDYWMEKKAEESNTKSDDYMKKLMEERKKQQEDYRLTSSINALAALGTAGGIGSLSTGVSDELGGAMAGSSILGAGGYHMARMLGAPKAVRVLSALAGAAGGGTLGWLLGEDVTSKRNRYR